MIWLLLCLSQSKGQSQIADAFHISKVPCNSYIVRIHNLISLSVKQFVGNVGMKYFILQFHGSLFDKYIAVKSLF